MVAAPAMPQAVERAVPSSRTQVQLSYAPLVKETAPAVVNIYTKKVVTERTSPLFADPFFRQFFGDRLPFGPSRERVQNSLGSGVLIDPAGLIVTNRHVINEADEVTVALSDRREFDAEIVQSDQHTDLALLKIDPGSERLPFARLGDSDALEVGDLVLAIGNPFGVGQTVTSGIVSALARTHLGISDTSYFIQTDAAINPGNSGGALVAIDGSVIGINTAIFSRSGGSQGIGFAIPVNLVHTMLDSYRAGGRVVRPWLGGSGQEVTSEVAQALGFARPRGVLISEVYPRGPLDRAGIRRGDVVLAVDGRDVDDPVALRFRITTRRADGAARFTLLRGGDQLEVAVPLEPPPEVPPRETTGVSGDNPLNGAVVANLSPAVVEEYGFEGRREGVVVLDVRDGSVAQRLGFTVGDVVLAVNGTEVDSVGDLVRVLGRGARNWAMSVQRGDRVLNLRLG